MRESEASSGKDNDGRDFGGGGHSRRESDLVQPGLAAASLPVKASKEGSLLEVILLTL